MGLALTKSSSIEMINQSSNVKTREGRRDVDVLCTPTRLITVSLHRYHLF